MIFLDASCLTALIGDEPAAAEVEMLLRRGDAAVTAINLAEAADVLGRRHGIDLGRARGVIEGLEGDALRVVAVDAAIAWRAAALRTRHYHREQCPLSLADCVLLGAPGSDEAIATSDAAVLGVATREDIHSVALPDSHGRAPR